MANKNMRRRETKKLTKKLKKDEKKAATVSPISTTPPVEVIPKGKGAKERRE